MPLLDYLKRRAGLEDLAARLSETEHIMASLDENSQELRSMLAVHERLQREFEANGGFGFDVEAKQVLKGLGFRPEEDAVRMTS